MLAKHTKFGLKNRKYPVEVMSNPLKGSSNDSKSSTSHGGKTKIHNNTNEHMYCRKGKRKLSKKIYSMW